MSLVSNKTWAGYQAWAERAGYQPSFDTKGPWFDYTQGADSQGALKTIGSRNTGKVYFEFNYTRQTSIRETEYHFGVATPQHNYTTLPGMSAYSWGLNTEDVGLYHDSTKTEVVDTYVLGVYESSYGFFYDYANEFYRDGFVIKIAIDFDAGKLWFGVFNGALDDWIGDPENGLLAPYTFTPNTPLMPVVGWRFVHTGFLCTASVQVCCSRDFARRSPPNGFEFWDNFDYQSEIIFDNPIAYWLGSPHEWNETFINNSLGYPGQFSDSSLHQRYTEHYSGAVYNNLKQIAFKIFPKLPNWCWYADVNTQYGKYPCPLASTASFSIEAVVLITGAGAINGTDDTWKEGSGLVCNTLKASQQASLTLAQLWTGISLRGRRLKFAVSPGEVTSPTDLQNGAYHLVMVWDAVAAALLMYLNGSLAAQTTGIIAAVNSTAYLSWGSMRPDQTAGFFPGYFRECAVYDHALSAGRVAAHYENLMDSPLPNPWDYVYPRTDWLVPPFIV